MVYLVSLPEVSYVKSDGEDILARWYPPKNMFFKFQVVEFEEGVTLEEMKSKLLVSESLVPLTPKEIAYYKKKYGQH
jgi:hypothetical protein